MAIIPGAARHFRALAQQRIVCEPRADDLWVDDAMLAEAQNTIARIEGRPLPHPDPRFIPAQENQEGLTHEIQFGWVHWQVLQEAGIPFEMRDGALFVRPRDATRARGFLAEQAMERDLPNTARAIRAGITEDKREKPKPHPTGPLTDEEKAEALKVLEEAISKGNKEFTRQAKEEAAEIARQVKELERKKQELMEAAERGGHDVETMIKQLTRLQGYVNWHVQTLSDGTLDVKGLLAPFTIKAASGRYQNKEVMHEARFDHLWIGLKIYKDKRKEAIGYMDGPTSPVDKGKFHPHGFTGYICYGNADIAFKQILGKMPERIVEYFVQMVPFAKSYNGKEQYHIQNWCPECDYGRHPENHFNRFECPFCKQKKSPAQDQLCPECEKRRCNHCDRVMTKKERWPVKVGTWANAERRTCPECDAKRCPICRVIGNEPGNKPCAECKEKYLPCSICGKERTVEDYFDKKWCKDCEPKRCKKCGEAVAIEGRVVCLICQAFACVECGVNITALPNAVCPACKAAKEPKNTMECQICGQPLEGEDERRTKICLDCKLQRLIGGNTIVQTAGK